MEKAKVYLFTSPTCPHCPVAHNFMEEFKKEREDIVYQEYSTATREGHLKAEKYGVMSVPTFIIRGHAYPQNIGLRGVQSKDAMNKYIDIALGKRELEEKKGFFAKLKEGMKLGPIKIKI